MPTETKVTHTPGPWRWFYSEERKGQEEIGIRPSDVLQAFAYVSIATPEDQANANLMVAAPDMLEALEHVEELATRQIQGGTPEQCHTQLAQLRGLIHRTAQAAIAKAKGGAA